eukprot:scaffold101587_cov14-Tisochrysis_lutea.AAC.1
MGDGGSDAGGDGDGWDGGSGGLTGGGAAGCWVSREECGGRTTVPEVAEEAAGRALEAIREAAAA